MPKASLLRFVVAPDGKLVADLKGSLPGRGMWVRPSFLQEGIKRCLFNRAHGSAVVLPEGFLGTLEHMIRVRTMKFLGLARRAGEVVCGFDQVQALLLKGRGGSVLAARDGSLVGRKKIIRAANGVSLVEVFDSAELSAAIGKENVVHVLVTRGKFSQHIIWYADVISCLQPADLPGLDAGLSVAV